LAEGVSLGSADGDSEGLAMKKQQVIENRYKLIAEKNLKNENMRA